MTENLTVSGGVHGIQADLDELARLAALLAGVAAELGRIAVQVAAIGRAPSFLLTSAFDPVGSTAVAVVLTSALGRLTVSIAGCRVLSDGVSAAALAYQLSDVEVSDLVTNAWHQVPAPVAAAAVGSVVGSGVLWVGVRAATRVGADAPWAAAALAQGAHPRVVAEQIGSRIRHDLAADGTAAVGWMVRHPGVAREAFATLPLAGQHLLPDDPRPGRVSSQMAGFAALMLATGRPMGLFAEGPVRVSSVQTSTQAGASGVRDLVARLAPLTSPRGSLVGYEPNKAGVLIDRVSPTTGGPPRWIVYLPPTSDWGTTGGRYPSDLTSNLAMVSKQGARSGRDPDAVDQALTAMRRAGIRPDEPVMLVGFSQGGITAASLASDPQVRAEYQVEAVLTAGSPISEFALDDDLAVLSLENDADLIPELDGATNPDQANWVTVDADVLDPVNGDAQTRERVEHGEVFAGHYLDGYIRTAEQLEATSNGSLRGWRQAVDPFLQGAEVATLEITVERQP